MPEGAVLVDIKGLSVGYKGAPLLPPVDLRVRRGELWAVLGPNGCGKTTLLRTLLGLLPRVGGDPGDLGAVRLGYVPQRATREDSVPQRVIDVVREGVERRWSFLDPLHRHRQRDAVERALKDTDIADLRGQQLGTLSEGQRQRALMARALACGPDLLVLDEPTSAMDVTAETRIFELLAKVAHERALAVLLVSHHLAVVAEHATHVLFLDRERQRAIHGPIAEVARSEAWSARFGAVMEPPLRRRFDGA